MARLLLDSGADPNGPDSAGGALMNAVRHLPEPAVLSLLIAHGAELEAGDGDSNTALNYAARDDRLDLARILLEAGADPNAQTERGYTVLQFARSDPMRALLKQYGGY
jgi:ankyrin repeat protein